MDRSKGVGAYIMWGMGGILLIVFLFGAYVLFNKPELSFVQELAKPKEDDVVMWNKSASHTLVVFSDFQCPACQTFHLALEPLESSSSAQHAVTQKVAYVFNYFPLYQIHQHAFTLAYAAQAAHLQGKFKEMSSYIFSRQRELDQVNIDSFLAEAVKSVGLDKQRFDRDRQSDAVKSKVNQDLSQGEKAGVNATPTFFLDGQKLESLSPQDLVRKLEGLK